MPNQIEEGTKFAAIHLTRCNRSEDLGDYIKLAEDLSAYARSIVDLTPLNVSRIGTDKSDDFSKANLVLMAACRSDAPTVRDAESKRLDQRVFMPLREREHVSLARVLSRAYGDVL